MKVLGTIMFNNNYQGKQEVTSIWTESEWQISREESLRGSDSYHE